MLHIFDIIILISGIAAVVGAFLIPTFQKIFSKGVMLFSVERSIPGLLLNSMSKKGINSMKNCVVAMVGSKMLGTFAAAFLLIPGAYAIVFAAKGIKFISSF